MTVISIMNGAGNTTPQTTKTTDMYYYYSEGMTAASNDIDNNATLNANSAVVNRQDYMAMTPGQEAAFCRGYREMASMAA